MWNNTETRSHVLAYAHLFPCLASHFKQQNYFKYPLIQQNNENLHLMKNLYLSWRWNTKSLAEVYATEVIYFYPVHLANGKNKNSTNCISRTKKKTNNSNKKANEQAETGVLLSLLLLRNKNSSCDVTAIPFKGQWFVKIYFTGKFRTEKAINEKILTLFCPYLLDKNWFHV